MGGGEGVEPVSRSWDLRNFSVACVDGCLALSSEFTAVVLHVSALWSRTRFYSGVELCDFDVDGHAK